MSTTKISKYVKYIRYIFIIKIRIISNNNYNLDKISDSEKEIIDTIIKLLKNKKVTDISEMSHREDGWKKTKRFEQISFDYAMNLKMNK